nr:MAG TPA: hypothetical protein [Caudoviricetes sp.]
MQIPLNTVLFFTPLSLANSPALSATASGRESLSLVTAM